MLEKLTCDGAFTSLTRDSPRVDRASVVDDTWGRFLSVTAELADDPATFVTWQSMPLRRHIHVRTGEDRRQTAHLPYWPTYSQYDYDRPRVWLFMRLRQRFYIRYWFLSRSAKRRVRPSVRHMFVTNVCRIMQFSSSPSKDTSFSKPTLIS